MNHTIGNKNVYKIFITGIKYVPNILALMQIISLTLGYFGISSFILTCVGGTSIILLVLLYLISIIFRFCGLYRLSLNYVTLITAMSIYDWYIGIPITPGHIYYVYAIISGVFIITWIIYWYTHRNNPKVDHIKRLCDNYVDCNC